METLIKKQLYPTVGQSISLIGCFILFMIIYAIPFLPIRAFLTEFLKWNSNLVDYLIFFILEVITFVTVIYIGLKRFRETNTVSYQFKFSKVPIGILLVAGIMVIAAGFITDFLTELIPMPDFFKQIFDENIHSDSLTFLSVVVAAPILEEILFRGIILEGFLKNYTPQKAIIWSALIFGIVHLNPWQAIGATVFGLIIGWLYWLTKSLIPGIVLHALNNLIGFALLCLFDISTGSLVGLLDSKLIFAVLLPGSVIVVCIGCYMLKKMLKCCCLTH